MLSIQSRTGAAKTPRRQDAKNELGKAKRELLANLGVLASWRLGGIYLGALGYLALLAGVTGVALHLQQ